jgi:hypothetical protein
VEKVERECALVTQKKEAVEANLKALDMAHKELRARFDTLSEEAGTGRAA